jgi:hypothetical protein
MGQSDAILAKEFARNYVLANGSAVKAYCKTFDCKRVNALTYIDAYLERADVQREIKFVLKKADGIAEPGEILQKLSNIMRTGSDKDSLKAGELLLRVNGKIDRVRKDKKNDQYVLTADLIKKMAGMSPRQLEAELTSPLANVEEYVIDEEGVFHDPSTVSVPKEEMQ